MDYPIVTGWLVYRLRGGRMEFLGIMQTMEKALADIEELDGGWEVVSVPLIGWGQVAPGVFGQNGPPPLKVVE